MSKRNLVIVAACVLLVVLWWTCHRSGSAAAASQASGGRRGGQGAGGPVPVVAGPVEQKDVPIYLDGLGTVQAFNTVMVRTRVDGELTQVLFKEGQDVKGGDLLAVVDPRPYQAALDEAIAKKAQDEAQLGNAQVILVRNADLLQRKVIDQQTYDTSKFSVDQFKGTVAADQAAIDNAKTQLDYTQIKSPIDGRTGIRMVDAGNVVHA
ncbi:MAG TPA: efflux RND transporter periplasmic adaptor subunit, partial [Chthoniobacterales bacterium]